MCWYWQMDRFLAVVGSGAQPLLPRCQPAEEGGVGGKEGAAAVQASLPRGG